MNPSESISLTTVIKNKSSQTLLDFLAQRFHYLNRSEWAERIRDGRVTVNETQASDGQPLKAGDAVTYVTEPWEEPGVNKNYRVVYEDASLFLVSKPAPLPVHAVGAYFRNTLITLLRKDIPASKDYQLVHRLDAETSGLILLVKDKGLVSVFQKQWEADVRKTYRAIVFGKFPESCKRVDAPIGPKVESSVRMKLAVVPHFEKGGPGGILVEGKPSITEFELLDHRVPHFEKGGPGGIYSDGFSLVEARILTGRTHQIRVHLEHLGHPIVGDKLYSGTDETFLHFYEKGWDEWLREKVLLPRLALHACRLEFTHPVAGEKMAFEDPLPDDLMSFWNGL